MRIPTNLTLVALLADGVQRPLPIEDAETVDARRAEVGLPALAESAEQLAEAYGAPASPEPLAAFP